MNFGGDAGLFPTIARANHACMSNADFVTRKALGVQDVVATADISAGEEITLNYLPASAEGSHERQTRLEYIRKWYGFHCTCSLCTLTVRPVPTFLPLIILSFRMTCCWRTKSFVQE